MVKDMHMNYERHDIILAYRNYFNIHFNTF
jgi:hypothetical protein